MDVHPTKNGINRHWSIATSDDQVCFQVMSFQGTAAVDGPGRGRGNGTTWAEQDEDGGRPNWLVVGFYPMVINSG